MTSGSGDEMVKDFYQRGAGELAVAHKRAGPRNSPALKPTHSAKPEGSRGLVDAAGTSDKQRKRARDQRLILALARLLASRTR